MGKKTEPHQKNRNYSEIISLLVSVMASIASIIAFLSNFMFATIRKEYSFIIITILIFSFILIFAYLFVKRIFKQSSQVEKLKENYQTMACFERNTSKNNSTFANKKYYTGHRLRH